MEKQKVLVVGSSGRMGQLVIQAIENSPDFTYLAGYCLPNSTKTTEFDHFHITSYDDFPYFQRQFGSPDIIIDFSKPQATMDVLKYASDYSCNKIPMVIATIGFSEEQQEKINSSATRIPIFQSNNMSYGANAVAKILEFATSLLSASYDINIFENYYSRQKDIPSRTAKIFFDAINKASGNNLTAVYGSYDSYCSKEPKQKGEVFISSDECIHFPNGQIIALFISENDCIRIERSHIIPSLCEEDAELEDSVK